MPVSEKKGEPGIGPQTDAGWYHMKRLFYHHIQASNRLLSLEEIASACSVSPEKIRGWVSAGLLRVKAGSAQFLDAVEVISFLIENKLPVSSSLLPPQTKKILFITASVTELEEQCSTIEHICTAFKERYNILSESAVIGRTADLTILASHPDLVVLFLKSYNRVTVNLFKLLDNRAVKTILLVDQGTQDSLDLGEFTLPGDLNLCEKTPENLLVDQVRTIFAC